MCILTWMEHGSFIHPFSLSHLLRLQVAIVCPPNNVNVHTGGMNMLSCFILARFRDHGLRFSDTVSNNLWTSPCLALETDVAASLSVSHLAAFARSHSSVLLTGAVLSL